MKQKAGKITGWLGFSAVMVLMLVMLAACNSGSSDSNADTKDETNSSSAPEKVTLTFWNGFTGPDGELLTEIVNDYNERNAGKVEIKMDIMPWDQLGQKLPPAIATDTAPSFVALVSNLATSYINSGSLQQLDDFFEFEGVDKSNFTDYSLVSGQQNGEQYLLPMQVNGLYLYWNKALFAEAGLDPGQAPQTFEELAEYAVKLSDPEQNRYGLGLPASGAPEYYVSFIRGNGGEVVNRENMTSALNSPENVKTFQWLQDLAVNKRVSPIGASGADLEKLMQSGQLAMLINGPWMAAGLKDNGIDFGVALPPKGSVRQSTVLGAVGFAIPRNTSPEEKEAVYDFLAYWNSKEIGKKWSLEVGFPPYLHSVIEDPEVQADPFVSVMADMSDAARPYLNGLVGAGKIHNDVMLLLIEALENGQDPEEAVRHASEQIDEILKNEP